MELIGLVLEKGNMGWDEILASPLLRINSIYDKAARRRIEEITGGMTKALGGLAGGSGGTPRPKGNAAEVLGGPQFETAEQYLAWRKEHGLD